MALGGLDIQTADEDLLSAFGKRKTKEKAFSIIVQKYQERIYWHIRKFLGEHEDANDVVQEVFLKAFKYLDNFKGDSGLYTWLYRIASNESINHINKNKKKTVDISEAGLETQQSSSDVDGDQVYQKLMEAIAVLPEKQRLVFQMKYFDDMKYDEISKQLNASVGGLKANYHHAVKKIEAFINGEEF